MPLRLALSWACISHRDYPMESRLSRSPLKAKPLRLPGQSVQDWSLNEWYERLRVRLLFSSYATVGLGTLASVAFLIARVT